MEPTDIRPRLREVAEDGAASPPARSLAASAAATQVLPPSAFGRAAADAGSADGPAPALEDALAYGFYARAAERGREPARAAGEAATTEMIARYRAQATADLHAHAFRYLHNHAEQIRHDAIREHLTHLRRPPGFLKLLAASLAGALLAGLLLHEIVPLAEQHGGIARLVKATLASLRGLGT